MPDLDGTGPRGKGSLTGRGLGKCLRGVSASGKIKVFSLAIPAVVAIVNDLRKPDGITRKICDVVKSGILGTARKRISRR